MTLVEVVRDDSRRQAVSRDGAALIEREVQSKRGVRGMAIKAGYKTLKRIRAGVVEQALDTLLPSFAPRIDPFYAQARESGDVRGYFTRNAGAMADALLSVTDDKAQHAQNRVMLKAYRALRKEARSHVADAAPGLADLILRHTDESQ